MSLNTLIEQILLSEQQLNEQTERIKEVKVAIIRCTKRIQGASEQNQDTERELDEKALQLSQMKLQYNLMKKCHDQMLKLTEELMAKKCHFSECLAKIKKQFKAEEERFWQEITVFNTGYSLGGNTDSVVESQTHTEILDLDKEVESINKEMEQLICHNGRVSSMREEKRELQLELQSLVNTHKELDQRFNKAKAAAESLRAERMCVRRKPLTDSTCLKLRKELEMFQSGELALRRDLLKSEIQFLKSDPFKEEDHPPGT